MGADGALESEQDADPEGQVEDFDELVRCAQSLLYAADPAHAAGINCSQPAHTNSARALGIMWCSVM